VVSAALPPCARAQEEPKVPFRDSERVALLGNEFFDKEQDQGYIETALTTRFPDKNLVFRNLGYAGDTVRGDARALCAGWANFGPADQGFERLRKQVQDARPTLIFIAFGMNESFDGRKGLEHFKQGYVRLLNMLEAEPGAKIVLVTPIAHEQLPPPLPDASAHNKDLALYSDAIRELAKERHEAVVDLFDGMTRASQQHGRSPLTRDGIHLTAFGYWRTANLFERLLGYEPRQWSIEIDAKAEKHTTTGTELKDVKAIEPGLQFTARDHVLPLAPSPDGQGDTAASHLLKIAGLGGGRYVLRCDDAEIGSGDASQWAAGISVHNSPDERQEEQLRKRVIAKNAEYFNFWRPENDTYIFGYRKHEQGQNGVEVPRFVPLVEQKDADIARLRAPEPHKYVLTRENPK
jgi:lysophospholipase L1-like esterase